MRKSLSRKRRKSSRRKIRRCRGKRAESPRYRIDHLTTDGLRDPQLFVRRGEELEQILDTISSRRSPVFVNGFTGSGKTCLISMVKRELRKNNGQRLKLAEVDSLNLDPDALVRIIAKRLKIRVRDGGAMEMLTELKRKLDPDNTNVIIVDEASDITQLDDREKGRVAATLRSLINLRSDDGRRLCSVIMTGLPESVRSPGTLEELAAVCETLRERLLGCRVTLELLTFKQAEEYVRKYLKFAGVNPNKITKAGINEIYERAKGNPRAINEVLLQIIKYLPKRARVPELDADFVRRAVGARPKLEIPEFRHLSPHKVRVLRTIAKYQPSGIRVPELAEELRHAGVPTSRSSVSGTVKELMEMGYVVREPSGKTHRVKLTDTGRRILLPKT